MLLGFTASGTQEATLPDIAGLRVWLKADAITGLNDGDAISTWADSSGNGYDFTQMGDSRPLYKTGIQNGKAGVLFDGTNDLMTMVSAAVTVGTVFVVAEYDGAGNFPTYNGIITETGSSIFYIIGRINTTTFLATGSSTPNMRVNGVATVEFAPITDTKVVTAWDTTPASIATLQLGKDRNNSRYWKGYMHEIIIYDTNLSTADKQAVEAYLASKYGITL